MLYFFNFLVGIITVIIPLRLLLTLHFHPALGIIGTIIGVIIVFGSLEGGDDREENEKNNDGIIFIIYLCVIVVSCLISHIVHKTHPITAWLILTLVGLAMFLGFFTYMNPGGGDNEPEEYIYPDN